jgi:hypothetical protein
LVLAWGWGESSWWCLLRLSHLLDWLLLWVEWGLWLDLWGVLWLSVGWLSEWVLLDWLLHWLLHDWSLLHHWLLRSSIHWLLLHWPLHNLSWRLLLHWLSVSLRRHRSLRLHRCVRLLSTCLWLVVNWLLLGELSLQRLLLRVWRVSILISWSLGGVLWIESSLISYGLCGGELLSLLEIGGSLPVIVHVSELVVDLLDLSIGQAVGLSVDQALDCGELVDQNKLWVISVVVDSIEIGLEELVIKVVAVSLVHSHVQDGAADLEKVLHDVLLIASVLLQIGLNQKVLLRLLQEGVELSVLFLE